MWIRAFLSLFVIALKRLLKDNFTRHVQNPLICLLIGVLGIPHGACDIYLMTNRYKKLSFASAIVAYLTVMSFWVALWKLHSLVAFALFLLVSIYHFGEVLDLIQEDLSYVESKYKSLLIFSRGLFLIGQMLFLEPAVAFPIISSFADIDPVIYNYLCSNVLFFLAIHLFIMLLVMPVGLLVVEVPKTILYWLVFDQLGILLGFAVFFGLWHSYDSITGIIDRLNTTKMFPKTSNSLLMFYKYALPYTIAGIFTIFFLVRVIDRDQIDTLWKMFIVGISVLTGAHVMIMSKLQVLASATDFLVSFVSAPM
jgi:Brp/Blh family beta-carotene 15,15'-monooxygenase